MEIVSALPHLSAASIRTHVVSRCCINAPKNHPHKWDYFERVERGVYELGARDVLRALGTFGFEVVSTRGSHAKLRRTATDGSPQILTLPAHREPAPGTLRAIFRQASRFIPDEELRRFFFV